MVQVRWTQIATDDLKSIYAYIARDSKKYAKREVIKIKVRAKILRTRPLLGKEVREKGSRNVRELIEGNYRIIYKLVDTKTIDILLIHHAARDLFRRGIQAFE